VVLSQEKTVSGCVGDYDSEHASKHPARDDMHSRVPLGGGVFFQWAVSWLTVIAHSRVLALLLLLFCAYMM